MGRKLDLSKLTDEEAKHVWEVVQRDLDLRKKEEERLEELKCRIHQESSKREFLSNQSHLNQTHCVHCLQPFQFLLNSKRQCLDCSFYTCKSCSCFSKKDQGWVCDPCRLSRIVKVGSLEWYYEHVRSRFKRFGSAKVLQSLHGRMQPGQGVKKSTFLGLQDRVYSLPDISSECHLTSGGPGEDTDDEDDVLGGAEAECYSRTRKTRRLLSVHPLDLELDSEFSARSRRHSGQFSPSTTSPGGFQAFPDCPTSAEDASQESRMEEADLVFHHRVLQEQGAGGRSTEQHFSTQLLLTLSARRRSLERNPKPGSPWSEQPRYSADMDTSDEDTKGAQFLSQHPMRHRSRTSSQETISHARNESPAPESPLDPDAEEEEELKRKLEELASNISDKEISSEEEEEQEEKKAKKPEMSSSSEDMDRDAQKVDLTAGQFSQLQETLKELEGERDHPLTTDSELSELEDKVASTAARVQQAESEISDIEARIAALSAAGLTVKAKKKTSGQATSLLLSSPTSSSPGESADDVKGLQGFRRRFHSPLNLSGLEDTFDRNSVSRGSLTQRNPNGKNRRVERLFAKPVMTHLS